MSVIVFGSANMDLVMPVLAVPVPGETVLTESYLAVPGGKGANQALAARRAGAKVSFAGAVGQDTHGESALSLLRAEGVDLDAVRISDRPTGCAVVMVDPNGENSIVVASGANQSVLAGQVSDALLDEAELLVLQQEIPLEENLQLAIRASRKGLRVVFNLAPARDVPDDLLESVDMLVVNEVEAVFLAGGHSVEDMSLLAGALASRHDFSVVITLGSDGAVVAPGGNAGSFSVKAPQVNVTDTTGAGDTFTGYLAARLAQGNLVLEKCISEAICAASLACTKAGAQAGIPYSSEVSKSTSFRA